MDIKGFALDTRSHPTAVSVKEKTEHPFRFAYIGGFAPDTPNSLLVKLGHRSDFYPHRQSVQSIIGPIGDFVQFKPGGEPFSP